MKQESLEQIKLSLINIYKNKGDKKALMTRGRAWTGNELAIELENETEFGIGLIENLINLTVDLVSRQKLEYE